MKRPNRSLADRLFVGVFFLAVGIMPGVASVSNAAPIQRVLGVITEVGEGYILLRPDGQASRMKLILRWKARFVPPKVPFAGDRVLILYKNKDEGAVIYEVNYLPSAAEGSAGPAAP
ncbi:MAG: hypothetical protein LDL33_05400 [Desulfomonile sp.]|nr:hypothetical protein [Desulfomonile sp.]